MIIEYETKSKVWDMTHVPDIDFDDVIDFVKSNRKSYYNRYRNKECLCFEEYQKHGKVTEELILETKSACENYLIYKYIEELLEKAYVKV